MTFYDRRIRNASLQSLLALNQSYSSFYVFSYDNHLKYIKRNLCNIDYCIRTITYEIKKEVSYIDTFISTFNDGELVTSKCNDLDMILNIIPNMYSEVSLYKSYYPFTIFLTKDVLNNIYYQIYDLINNPTNVHIDVEELIDVLDAVSILVKNER